MVEGNIKIPRLQVGRVGGGGTGIDFEILGLELGDEVDKGASDVREKPIVLFLYRVCEDVVLQQKVGKVDVEGGELVFAHGVDLLHVYDFPVLSLGYVTV